MATEIFFSENSFLGRNNLLQYISLSCGDKGTFVHSQSPIQFVALYKKMQGPNLICLQNIMLAPERGMEWKIIRGTCQNLMMMMILLFCRNLLFCLGSESCVKIDFT